MLSVSLLQPSADSSTRTYEFIRFVWLDCSSWLEFGIGIDNGFCSILVAFELPLILMIWLISNRNRRLCLGGIETASMRDPFRMVGTLYRSVVVGKLGGLLHLVAGAGLSRSFAGCELVWLTSFVGGL